ncbi:MAG: FkbM family methyltransferase [Acidimicrobiia bacterium]
MSGAISEQPGDGADRSIPRIIHFVWLGSEPPPSLKANIEHLGALAPDWEVRLWSDDDFGWLVNRRWFDEAPTYAGRANIARYEILHRHGGLYVDADFDFLQSPGVLDLGEHGLAIASARSGRLNNAFIAASPGHPFISRLVERVGASIDQRPGAPSQMTSGPDFLTQELVNWTAETGERSTEIPRDLVHPYSFDRLDRASGPWSPQVVAIHRWDQTRSGRAWVHPHKEPPRTVRQRLGGAAEVVLSRVRPRHRLKQCADWVRRMRWRPNGFSLGDGRAFTVLRSGRPIVFDSEDAVQLGNLAANGRLDDSFLRFLGRTLSGSDVYVDVGANIGQFVIEAMRHLGRFGRVFAFEPNPRITAILRKNVMLHRTTGARGEVIIHECGVSDHRGTGVLHVPRSHGGRGTIWSATVEDVDRATIDEIDVELVRLDDVLGHLSHIRVLKIDVEGNEPNVLAGASELIESGRVDLGDVEAVRRHLGPRRADLADLLSGWERQGATFWAIDGRGRLQRHSRPIASVLTTADRSHLVIDTRVFGERARAAMGPQAGS